MMLKMKEMRSPHNTVRNFTNVEFGYRAPVEVGRQDWLTRRYLIYSLVMHSFDYTKYYDIAA